VSVENSSLRRKEKGKISQMQDSHTFLQKGLVSQKGSDFLTFVHRTRELENFLFVGSRWEKNYSSNKKLTRARGGKEREKRGIRREWKWWKRAFSVFTRSSIQSVTGEEEEEEREEREKNNSKFEKPWSRF
jgi:hypothetical protein